MGFSYLALYLEDSVQGEWTAPPIGLLAEGSLSLRYPLVAVGWDHEDQEWNEASGSVNRITASLEWGERIEVVDRATAERIAREKFGAELPSEEELQRIGLTPPRFGRKEPRVPWWPEITEEEARERITRLLGNGARVELHRFEFGWTVQEILSEEERERGMHVGQQLYIVDLSGVVTAHPSLPVSMVVSEYNAARQEWWLTGRQVWPEPEPNRAG
jgi:hypothetical protein